MMLLIILSGKRVTMVFQAIKNHMVYFPNQFGNLLKTLMR